MPYKIATGVLSAAVPQQVAPAGAGLAQIVKLHGKLRPIRITSGLVLVDYGI